VTNRFVELLKTNVTGGFMFVDDRYAHAADYTQAQTTQTKQIDRLRVDTAIQLEQIQLNSIDDKIFYLEQKTSRTSADVAQMNRFIRQRQDTTERIRAIQQNPPR
jgi:hypothetical protein